MRKKQRSFASKDDFDEYNEDVLEDYARGKKVRSHRHAAPSDDVFKCRNCRRFIGPPPSGGHHRNHCPFCLFSLHVDVSRGDRQSACGSRMAPIGYFQRPTNGEYMLVHRCLGCEFERFNRIAADDDFDLVLSLPEVPPRTSREMKSQRILQEMDEESEREYFD
jgi:hypothetical protein